MVHRHGCQETVYLTCCKTKAFGHFKVDTWLSNNTGEAEVDGVDWHLLNERFSIDRGV